MKNYITILFVLMAINGFSQRTIDKEMGNFNQVKVFDLIEVNLIKSDENRVLVKGRNVSDINLVNKNGVLKIRMELDKIFSGEDTFVEVYYIGLDVIDGNEGSRITSNETIEQNSLEIKAQEGAQIKVGLKVNHLEVRAVTGGIIEASGMAENQDVVLNTGGIFEGKELRTENTSVKITAAGEAEIFATEYVDVNIKAGGNVYVFGKPKEVNEKTFAGGVILIMD
jgi:hypothetical protein